MADEQNDLRWTRAMLLGALVVTLLLYYVPALRTFAYPFVLFSTFVHEMGHGVAAVLMGGDFLKLEMWSDASGLATYAIASDAGAIRKAIVSAGGLCGAPILAALGFWLGRTAKKARIALGVGGLLSLLSLIFVVRTMVGVVMSVCLVAICALLIASRKDRLQQGAVLFFSTELALCVFSRADYLFTNQARTATGVHVSDVGHIANELFLPYWFWGGLIALFSVLVLFLGVRGFFKKAAPSGDAA